MKTNLIISIVLVFHCISVTCHSGSVPQSQNGKKYRIGYYEGGPYSDYTDTMRMFILGLIELGWIEKASIPDLHGDKEKPYWDWLSQCASQYVTFNKKDGYSANWEESNRKQINKELQSKLQDNSLDLIIAMGTWAGQDLANNTHSVPVLVMSSSNPVAAGIVKSSSDPGYDHVTARVDSDRYIRQLRMFHRIVGFSTLGVAFENSPDGRIYSVIDEIEQISKERQFEPVLCEVIDTTSDREKSNQSCIDCYKKLAESTDAVYITALTCADRQMKKLADIFIKAKTPTFSLNGSKFVKEGLLLSISSDSGYTAIGKYYAEKFGKILNGTSPRELEQEFADPLDIAVNLQTAEKIGFEIPRSILKIAAEVYQ